MTRDWRGGGMDEKGALGVDGDLTGLMYRIGGRDRKKYMRYFLIRERMQERVMEQSENWSEEEEEPGEEAEEDPETRTMLEVKQT